MRLTLENPMYALILCIFLIYTSDRNIERDS